MLKGGVIMDVVSPEHAVIAEEAGAVAVGGVLEGGEDDGPGAAGPGADTLTLPVEGVVGSGTGRHPEVGNRPHARGLWGAAHRVSRT